MNADLQQLNHRFGIPGLQFELGANGLTRAVINTPIVRGELYLQGAHVTGFQPFGHAQVLWMSEHSYFESGKPIRGGVPICFPWFGANLKNPQSPAHGLARTVLWDVVASSRRADGGVALELSACLSGFKIHYVVEFGSSLQLVLNVELEPDENDSRDFEEALHTYFVVGDIEQVTIEGLDSFAYLDKVGGTAMRPAAQNAIRFSSETDRVYVDTNATCRLCDPSLQRRITVRQANSRSTVIWNPWIDKSARMPDFGDDEWTGMVCIETANVIDQAIAIEPGQRHTMVARVEVEHELNSR